MAESVAKQLGKWAEQHAAVLLAHAGYQILRQNYHSRFGEIDVIALKQHDLLFIEVKARGKTTHGQANEVVTLSKQKKIVKTALSFLDEFPQYHPMYMRFDIICFDFHQEIAKNVQHDFAGYTYDQQWIENAFTLDADLFNL